jgi:hypothetical protein
MVSQRPLGHGGERDGHDLGREDEVGADRAGHLLLFEILGAERQVGRGLLAFRSVGDRLDHLLGRLETEVGTAQHQQRRHRPGREGAEQQGARQQDQELVAQGAHRDLPDDRQLAVRGEADGVAGRDGGVVDHHAGGLGARLAGRAGDVVQRGRRQLGDAGDVVEQCGETRGHGVPSALVARARDEVENRQRRQGVKLEHNRLDCISPAAC